jgi:acyl-CoA thioesterase I
MRHRLLNFIIRSRYAFRLWIVNASAAIAIFICATSANAETEIRILALGDSLMAGYGLAQPNSFPSKLEHVLKNEGLTVKVINAGVSGDTSAGGLARLEWSLVAKPHAVVLALGANDGLRGLDPKTTFDNLDAIVSSLGKKGIAVLLVGMKAPPNLGKSYGAEYDAIFPTIAKAHQLELYPFFLKGVVTKRELNQKDGIHPNEAGVGVIVRNILPYIKRMISRVRKAK